MKLTLEHQTLVRLVQYAVERYAKQHPVAPAPSCFRLREDLAVGYLCDFVDGGGLRDGLQVEWCRRCGAYRDNMPRDGEEWSWSEWQQPWNADEVRRAGEGDA